LSISLMINLRLMRRDGGGLSQQIFDIF